MNEKYTLQCLTTKDLVEDNYTLHYTDGALLRTIYHNGLTVNQGRNGMMKFHDWMPNYEISDLDVGTQTYQAEALGNAIGMNNLWVTFHGYWPERNGLCPTGSFKDMEAVPTLIRLKEKNCEGLICASAGNTARAFAYFCGLYNVPIIIVVSHLHAKRLYVPDGHPTDSVKLIVLEDGDYYDAKVFSKKLAKHLDNWQMEGSVHNVARRDGIGSLILDAAFTIGAMPQHYFQGIGGGPGPIGVHEMAVRAIDAGFFDGPPPRQHVSQNVEHSPIHNAWQANRDHLIKADFPDEEVTVYSDYLLNKSPAYDVKGGVHDILKQSNGQTYVVEKEAAVAAKELFEQTEGIDIMTPGGVALASLIQALEVGEINSDDCTVLNISGGGVERMKSEVKCSTITPWMTIAKSAEVGEIIDLLE